MKFKRIIILLLALILSLSLSGCAEERYEYVDECQRATEDGMLSEVYPEIYRGTSVTYVTWKDPDISEDGVAYDTFEEKYGIQINVQLISQNTAVSTLAADIAAGTQGDIFLDAGHFPSSLSVLQPLTTAKIDLENPFWNRSIIKASTLDGYPYLIDAFSNLETQVDICVYNKRIFRENDIKSPKDYHDEGKWTFENFYFAAKEVSKLGKEYTGVGILDETVFGAAGCSFFAYKNNKIELSMEPSLMQAMDLFARMKTEGIAKPDRKGFQEGMQGMAFTTCHGLRKIGYFTAMNPDDLGATYLPVWNEGDEQQVTAPYRGYGIIEGAKNPVAAGLFLRTYLDVEVHDLSNEFHNPEVAHFFFEVTGAEIVYYRALDMAKEGGAQANCLDAWYKNSPDKLNAYFASETERLNKMVEDANKIFEDERAWIKEAEENGEI